MHFMFDSFYQGKDSLFYLKIVVTKSHFIVKGNWVGLNTDIYCILTQETEQWGREEVFLKGILTEWRIKVKYVYYTIHKHII